MTPDQRATLLHGLEALRLAYSSDPHRLGEEALRLLRQSGASWRDLLGEPFKPEDYPFRLFTYGHMPPDPPRDFGRLVMTYMAHALPEEAATAAVLANRTTLAPEDLEELHQLARGLAALRASEDHRSSTPTGSA